MNGGKDLPLNSLVCCRYLGLKKETIFLSMRGTSAFHSVAENPQEEEKTEALPHSEADISANTLSSITSTVVSPASNLEEEDSSKKRKRISEGNGFGRGEKKKAPKAAQATKLLPLSRMPTKVNKAHFFLCVILIFFLFSGRCHVI